MAAAGHYHCSVKPVGRGSGASVTAKAAYRSGECLFDQRTGEFHDYSRRHGVIETFIMTREGGASVWQEQRERLWNEAERAEARRNGRLATELELALPHELDAGARKALLTGYLRPIIERHGVAADVAMHTAHDDRNIHAHVLLTHRELGPDGFGEIANTRTVNRKRQGEIVREKVAGIAATPADVKTLREQWAQHVNRAYERAGLDIRVDHRSFDDRGIPAAPTIHLGPTAAAMERRGRHSDRGDINREIAARNALQQALEGEVRQVDAQIIDFQAAKAEREAARGRHDIPPRKDGEMEPERDLSTSSSSSTEAANQNARDLEERERRPGELLGAQDFGKAAFDAGEPDAKLREAWRQPAFSRASIDADPWTAVYLAIPKEADTWLLMKAHDAAHQCQDMIGRGPGDGPQLRQGSDGPAENMQRAAERVDELAHRIALAPKPERRREFSPEAHPAPEASTATTPGQETKPASEPQREKDAIVMQALEALFQFDQQTRMAELERRPETVFEARQTPKATAAPTTPPEPAATPTGEPQRAAPPPFEHPVIVDIEDRGAGKTFTGDLHSPKAAAFLEEAAARKLASEQAATGTHGIRSLGGIGRRLLDAIGDRFESAIHFLADLVAPPPPLTRDQAERAMHAAGERRQEAADIAYRQEQDAAVDNILFEQGRQQQQADLSLAERFGTPPTREANLGREHDHEPERDL